MGWKSNEPWHRELGGWFTKEAVPFVKAGVKGTLAGGPYMGAVAALTATNKRGGNPLGKFGKEANKIVKPVVEIASIVNTLNSASKIADKKNENASGYVLC